ncbi:hypothetical protein Q9S36_03125 [Microbacterium sp. ARD31]|nr:hypothetical protein [Microbacterium sp. ARD31]MDT0179200.1 hypothetical protein [Microbacterium sp. ARD31]
MSTPAPASTHVASQIQPVIQPAPEPSFREALLRLALALGSQR